MKREPKIRIENVSYSYDGKPALRNVTLDVPANAITVFFGPAGGGKTTLLRLINRLNDLVEGTQMSGRILLDGQDVYTPGTDLTSLRRRVGMVFALPLPLPGTVRENVLYGLKLAGVRNRTRLDEILVRSLHRLAAFRGENHAREFVEFTANVGFRIRALKIATRLLYLAGQHTEEVAYLAEIMPLVRQATGGSLACLVAPAGGDWSP